MHKWLALLLIAVVNVTPGVALSASPQPQITANSCRLYNAYYMNGMLYSDSQGTTYNGAYKTAKTLGECQKMCLEDEKSRTEELPNIYKLNVECFYGQRSLYKKLNIQPPKK